MIKTSSAPGDGAYIGSVCTFVMTVNIESNDRFSWGLQFRRNYTLFKEKGHVSMHNGYSLQRVCPDAASGMLY